MDFNLNLLLDMGRFLLVVVASNDIYRNIIITCERLQNFKACSWPLELWTGSNPLSFYTYFVDVNITLIEGHHNSQWGSAKFRPSHSTYDPWKGIKGSLSCHNLLWHSTTWVCMVSDPVYLPFVASKGADLHDDDENMKATRIKVLKPHLIPTGICI